MTLPLPAFAAGLWLLAFLSSFPWIDRFEPEFLILSLGSLVAAMAVSDWAGISSRIWSVPRSAVLTTGAAFWLLALISMIVSPIPFVAWIYFCYFSALPLTIVFFLCNPAPEIRLRLAHNGLIVITAGLAIYAVVQYFFLPNWLIYGRVHVPLADPNSLAAIFSVVLFMVLGDILRGGAFIPRLAVAGLLFAALFVTGSRGAYVSFAIMAIAFAISAKLDLQVWKKLSPLAVLVVIAAIVIGVVTPTQDAGPFKLLRYTLDSGWNALIGERPLIWSSTLEIIRAHPFFGTGPGTFPFYYAEVRQAGDFTAGYAAHNDPLQFGAEMGVGAILVFYLFIILAMIRTTKAMRQLAPDDPVSKADRIKILAPFFAMASLILHTHMTFNLHVLPCLFLSGYVFALWHWHSGEILQDKVAVMHISERVPALFLQSLFLVVVLGLMIAIAAPVYTQRLIVEANRKLETGDVDGFAHDVNLTDTLSLGMNAQAHALAVRIPIGILKQSEHPVSAQEREKFIRQAHDIIARGEQVNPRNVSLVASKAELAVLEGREGEAEHIYRDCLRLDPHHLPARLELADILAHSGRRNEALALLDAGSKLVYNPAKAQRLMEMFIKAENLRSEIGK